MTLKEIEKIIKDFEKSSLRELELELDGVKLKLSKNENTFKEVIQTEKELNNEKETNELNVEPVINYPSHEITSPLVGTFYAASNPDSDPYVKVGQKIKKGDTLCIIEAMKIMNEITSDFDGVIEKINFNNGDVVGFNDPIMVVVKDGN